MNPLIKLFLPVFCFLPVFLQAQTKLDEIIGDITLQHEGRPHGVPSSVNWAVKPRVGAMTPQAGWNAVIAWGQVYEWINGNPATNTRVQIKDLELYYLSKKDNKWHLLQKSVGVDGNAYVEDFAGDVNKSADKRIEKDGSVSVKAGGGYNFHFWSKLGRVKYPVNDVAGCYVTVKARLVVDKADLPDDRATARYLMSVGGDWWESLTAKWNQFKTNADMGIGRFRFVTNEWKSFNMISAPLDSVSKNPPPFLSSATAINEIPSDTKTEVLIAQTPPMGWNSYNCFGGNVTEAEVKANADYMAEKLKTFGWEYIVVDFLWYCDDQNSAEKFANRRPEQHIDEYGRLIPSVKLHPSSEGGKGLKPLADYVHSKGLKFGLHIMRGIARQAITGNTPIKNSLAKADEIANLADTCVWYGGLTGVNLTKEGGQEYYNSLFELYAEWGVDYIKVDDIVYPYHADEIEAVHKAILNCGRPIVLSLSPGPAFIGNPKHLRENANLWRISGDFWDKWSALKRQLELCRDWAPMVTEGHWPDADMLPLGKLNIRTELKDGKPRYTNFTKDEQYFLMTLWSIFRSPLMIGGNMPDNDDFTVSLLTNDEMLRVNQHSTNNKEISFKNGISIWTADDKENMSKYIAILNVSDQVTEVMITSEECGIKSQSVLRNLWIKSDLGAIGKGITISVPAHGAMLFSAK